MNVRIPFFLKRAFLHGLIFFIFLAAIVTMFTFLDNILTSTLRFFLAPLDANNIINIPPFRYAIAIGSILIVGALLLSGTVKKTLLKIPIVSMPLKIAESIERLRGLTLVRVEFFEGCRKLGGVAGVEVVESYELDRDNKLVPVKKPVIELRVFVSDLPAPSGSWSWFELRRLELILNPKNEVLARALSAGFNAEDKSLKTVKLSGKGRSQLQTLLNLSEEELIALQNDQS